MHLFLFSSKTSSHFELLKRKENHREDNNRKQLRVVPREITGCVLKSLSKPTSRQLNKNSTTKNQFRNENFQGRQFFHINLFSSVLLQGLGGVAWLGNENMTVAAAAAEHDILAICVDLHNIHFHLKRKIFISMDGNFTQSNGN